MWGKKPLPTITDQIKTELLSWPGVTWQPHRFGGIEFRCNGHELGHLHGSRQADLPFPVRVREKLVASERASLHHVLPQTGWVSYYITGPESIPGLLDLFRLNYDRLNKPVQIRGEPTDEPSVTSP
jgi:hypothetical protein